MDVIRSYKEGNLTWCNMDERKKDIILSEITELKNLQIYEFFTL